MKETNNKVIKSRERSKIYITSLILASGLALSGYKSDYGFPHPNDNQYDTSYSDAEFKNIIDSIKNINTDDETLLDLYVLFGITFGSTLYINLVEDYINSRRGREDNEYNLIRVESNVRSLTRRHRSNC